MAGSSSVAGTPSTRLLHAAARTAQRRRPDPSAPTPASRTPRQVQPAARVQGVGNQRLGRDLVLVSQVDADRSGSLIEPAGSQKLRTHAPHRPPQPPVLAGVFAAALSSCRMARLSTLMFRSVRPGRRAAAGSKWVVGYLRCDGGSETRGTGGPDTRRTSVLPRIDTRFLYSQINDPLHVNNPIHDDPKYERLPTANPYNPIR